MTNEFVPGTARIGWEPSALVVDFAFVGVGAQNQARRLNERTHLLGDVGEIFVQWRGSDRYIEIHLTPENQRLQLDWTGERLEAVRNRRATLEDFAVADPDWVRSVTKIASTFWSARLLVPASVVIGGDGRFGPETALRVAVCRYDYRAGTTPVLSSTANFHGRPFHTRTAWSRLSLKS